MSTELAPVPSENPLALLHLAIDKGIDPDKLGKLMDLAERWQAGQAAAKFGEAMTKFQSMVPTVFKSKTAKVKTRDGGEYRYQFASYDDVMREAAPVLAQCGLAVTFDTEQAERFLRIKCHVRHGTHVQTTLFSVPVPDNVQVNEPQKMGIALSYAKRYALCAALNIVVTGEDSDAAGLVTTISDDQQAEIEALMEKKGIRREPLLKWLQIERLEDLRMADYVKTVDYLTRKKDVQPAGGAT